MKLREFDHELDFSGNAPDFVRSTGLHMSDIYNSLYKQLDPDRYDKRDEDGDPEKMNWMKVAAGSVWERYFEPLLAAKYGGCRPGEFFTQHAVYCSAYQRPVKDGSVLCHCGAGVAFSPDWLFESPKLLLGEFKFTWYSSRNFPYEAEKFDKWLCQVMAYLYHLRMDTCWVFPYWVNGKYPGSKDKEGKWHPHPPTPDVTKAYELVFTPKELWNNWAALLKHAWKEGMIP